jgi:hypothetical protein
MAEMNVKPAAVNQRSRTGMAVFAVNPWRLRTAFAKNFFIPKDLTRGGIQA